MLTINASNALTTPAGNALRTSSSVTLEPAYDPALKVALEIPEQPTVIIVHSDVRTAKIRMNVLRVMMDGG
ncbi:MAG: hypothetical protein QF704_06855 [Anaerolineales bacterium]|nr:hypothetical protein [Anaerolineales bacterium]